MAYIGILFAIFYALLFSWIFSFFFKKTGPWKSIWIFFLITFLVAFIAGELIPLGPTAWGYYWLPGLLAAIIIALLLAASTPASRQDTPDSDNETDVQKELTAASYYSIHATPKGEPLYKGDEPEEGVVFTAFFWIFILLLMMAAVLSVFFG